MKKLPYFFFLFLLMTCFARADYILFPKGSLIFVSENHGPYRLSNFRLESYEIYTEAENDLVFYGIVEKWNEWTRTYTFKAKDGSLSTHRSSFFSYGTFLDRLKEFEIRDDENVLLGYIAGSYYTDAQAEFLFFNDQHELLAKANVHRSNPQLTIHSPDGQILITGIRTLRNLSSGPSYTPPDYEYFWTIKKEDNISFDSRFLWPFVGFIAEVWWYSSPFEVAKKPLGN